jgi:hypothetical protein
VRAYVAASLSGSDAPGDRVRKLFEAVAQRLVAGDFRKSCAAGAVALDLSAQEESIGSTVAGEFGSWIDVIARCLPFLDESRRQAFAGLVLTTIEGGYVRGRAERSVRPLLEAGAWLAELADREALCL